MKRKGINNFRREGAVRIGCGNGVFLEYLVEKEIYEIISRADWKHIKKRGILAVMKM